MFERKVLVSALVVMAIFAVACTASAESSEANVSLRWALGALDTREASPSAIKKDTQLDGGTRLKFLVEPLSPGSVYLILLDSSDDVHVLFNETNRRPAGLDPAYVPPGSQWFELDDESGMETFFLLASAEPLAELEDLLARHATADPAAKAALSREIVTEIRRQHKAHRNFSRPVERPVLIGGSTRGEVSDAAAIDRLAVEITAERFYGKTITIEH